MSQSSLIEKIKQGAAKTVAEIEAAAAAEIAAIERETEAVLKNKQAEQAIAIEKATEHAALVASSKAKQAGNIAFQNAKRKEIDGVFAEFHTAIKNLESDEYVALSTKLAEIAIPEKVTATDVFAPKGRVEETQKVLKKFHIDASITEMTNLIAGMVVHTKDGVYDASLDRMLSEQRPELEIELMNMVEAK